MIRFFGVPAGRNGLRLAALALAAGCATPKTPAAPPAPSDLPAVPKTFLESLVTRRQSSGVTLKAFNTGSVRTRGAAVSSLRSWSSKVRLDVPVFLISHPGQGPILFDTGLSTRTAAALNRWWLPGSLMGFESRPGQDIASQLRSENIGSDDVKWIVLSHLHLDHSGMVGSFPRATVVASRREWEALKTSQAARRNWREFDPAAYEGARSLRLVDFEEGPPFGAFDRSLDLFSDGTVILVDLSGHTEGSLGAWVNLDGGPVLLAGDSCLIVDNYLDLALPASPAIADLGPFWRRLHMMRAMQEAAPRLVIFPGHDLTPRTLSSRDDLPLVLFQSR